MSTPELFPLAAVQMDSPRLAWIKRERVVTYCSKIEPPCWYAAFDTFDVEYTDPYDYFAKETGSNGDHRIGLGLTEDDALVALCRKHSVKLWNEEAP